MTARSKLWIANVLMVLGIVPLVLGICWIFAVIAYAKQHKGLMGGSDAFLMLGMLLVSYAFALLVSGGSAVWSAFVARRDTRLRPCLEACKVSAWRSWPVYWTGCALAPAVAIPGKR